MQRPANLYLAVLLTLFVAGVAYTALVDSVWALLFAGLGLLYGSASTLSSARGLQYLVAVAPHAALMAAGLAPLALGLAGIQASGAQLTVATLALGVPAVAAAAHAASRARARDEVVSGFLAVSVVVALLGIHVSAELGYWTPVSALIAGDPLLATPLQASLVALLGLAALVYTLLTIKLHVYHSIDPDDARLAGTRIAVHDVAVTLLIALATVGLVWITGFIVQHVLLLLPAIAATRLAKSASDAAIAGIATATAASAAGVAAAIIIDLPPAAGIGTILLLLAAAAAIIGRR